MSTFTIDNDNHITAYASAEQASQGDKPGLIHFDSQWNGGLTVGITGQFTLSCKVRAPSKKKNRQNLP